MPNVVVREIVSGSSQTLDSAAAIALIRSDPTRYIASPPDTVSREAFLAAAILQAFRESTGLPSATYTDLIDALTAGSPVERATVADIANDAISNSFARVAGKTVVGDGRDALYVQQDPNVDPGTDSGFQDVDGQWWDLAKPTEFENIDFEWFCRKHNSHETRLVEAHKALFNETSSRPLLLDGQGIEVLADRPILLRNIGDPYTAGHAVLNMGNTRFTMMKTVRNLNLCVNTASSYMWQPRDYVFSIAGIGGGIPSGNLRSFVLDRCTVDLRGTDVIGVHVSGYYHLALVNLGVRGITAATPNAAGFATTRFNNDTGVGVPSGITVVDNGNHGLEVINLDVLGTSGADAGLAGILGDGDVNLRSGLVDWLAAGFWVQRGGVNSYGVHFTLSDSPTGRAKPAYIVDAPRVFFSDGDETDGAYFLLRNPADNMFTRASDGTIGASFDGWNGITVRSSKWGSAVSPAWTGPAILSNDFSSSAGWTVPAGWTISGGVATHANGSANDLQIAIAGLIPGKKYVATLVLSAYTSGTVTPKFQGGATTPAGTAASAVGVKNTTLIAVSGITTFAFTPSSNFVGSIDRIDVYEAAGLIECTTETPGQGIVGLVIDSDQANWTGDSAHRADLVNFSVTGAGAWDPTAFNSIWFRANCVFGVDPGSFPAGVTAFLANTAGGQLLWDTEAARLIFAATGTNGNYPYIRATSGNFLFFGRMVSGVATDYLSISSAGHLLPTLVSSAPTYNLGSATQPFLSIWSCTVNAPSTATNTGSPEGRITAPVGSIYQQNDAAAGVLLWVKDTGSGNTGWRPLRSPRSQTLATDVAFTLTPLVSPSHTYHTGTLTADRAVTLDTTGVYDGCQFRVIRTGPGAFNLNVGTGPLKALVQNTWAEFTYDGVTALAWKLTAYGAL